MKLLSIALCILKGTEALTCKSCEGSSYATCVGVSTTRCNNVSVLITFLRSMQPAPRPILLMMAPSRTGVAPSWNIDDQEARSTMSLLVADRWKLACPIKTKTTPLTITSANVIRGSVYQTIDINQVYSEQCWSTDKRKTSKCRICCDDSDGCNAATLDAAGVITWP